MTESLNDYKSTVFLPRTEFPMRGELPKNEPAMLRRWEEMGLWARLREAGAGRDGVVAKIARGARAETFVCAA